MNDISKEVNDVFLRIVEDKQKQVDNLLTKGQKLQADELLKDIQKMNADVKSNNAVKTFLRTISSNQGQKQPDALVLEVDAILRLASLYEKRYPTPEDKKLIDEYLEHLVQNITNDLDAQQKIKTQLQSVRPRLYHMRQKEEVYASALAMARPLLPIVLRLIAIARPLLPIVPRLIPMDIRVEYAEAALPLLIFLCRSTDKLHIAGDLVGVAVTVATPYMQAFVAPEVSEILALFMASFLVWCAAKILLPPPPKRLTGPVWNLEITPWQLLKSLVLFVPSLFEAGFHLGRGTNKDVCAWVNRRDLPFLRIAADWLVCSPPTDSNGPHGPGGGNHTNGTYGPGGGNHTNGTHDQGGNNGTHDPGGNNGTHDPGGSNHTNGTYGPGGNNGTHDPGGNNGTHDPGGNNGTHDPGGGNHTNGTHDPGGSNHTNGTHDPGGSKHTNGTHGPGGNNGTHGDRVRWYVPADKLTDHDIEVARAEMHRLHLDHIDDQKQWRDEWETLTRYEKQRRYKLVKPNSDNVDYLNSSTSHILDYYDAPITLNRPNNGFANEAEAKQWTYCEDGLADRSNPFYEFAPTNFGIGGEIERHGCNIFLRGLANKGKK
jgi:hypothetical protein